MNKIKSMIEEFEKFGQIKKEAIIFDLDSWNLFKEKMMFETVIIKK